MSWVNLSTESEMAANDAYVDARQEAFEERDHTEALKKLDNALHELHTISLMVRFLAPVLGCKPKDVWEKLNIIDHRRKPPNPFKVVTENSPSVLS